MYIKHVYELVGFKEILGLDLINQIQNEDHLGDGQLIDMPTMSVQLR